MHYHHTQRGWLHWILYGSGVGIIGLMVTVRDQWEAVVSLAAATLLLGIAAMAFHFMTVRDEGDALAIYYGPLPLFRKRIRYDEITAVEPGRTSIIDGWGIHYIPGRGWTYNLWGFGCARLQLGQKVVRIGTDDVDSLVSFLRRKVQSPIA